MKPLILFLNSTLICLGLSACTYVVKPHPVEVINRDLITEPIVAFFSADAGRHLCNECLASEKNTGYSTTPISNGYYRKLLARDVAGRFLVQDFYQNSHQKQTDPFWIKYPKDLHSFDASTTDGEITTYFENGKISAKSTYKNNKKIGKIEGYYSNGQLGIVEEFTENAPIKQKIWYENGKVAANILISQEGKYLITNGQVWDQDGKHITDQAQAQNILNQRYKLLNQ